jgi:hypothetical protein
LRIIRGERRGGEQNRCKQDPTAMFQDQPPFEAGAILSRGKGHFQGVFINL